MDAIGSWVGTAVGALLVVLSVAVVVRFRHTLTRARAALAATAGPVRPPEQGLDLYELGYLRRELSGGFVLAAALVRMHAEGRLALVEKQYSGYDFRVVDAVPRDEAETLLLKLLDTRRGNLPPYVHLCGWKDDPFPVLHERLVVDGLFRELGLPEGIPSGAPRAAAWRAARRDIDRLRAPVVITLVAAGGLAALMFGAWLPFAVQLVALVCAEVWYARSRPVDEWEARKGPSGQWGPTAAGHAAVERAMSAQLPPDEKMLRKVAWIGLDGLPDSHPLYPAPRPVVPHQDRPPEPEPEPQINFDPPGLGGL
ncbi:hypothetical protein ABT160_27060 [Streptomyces sp. NPDC001941]|uniref:hypothetical protein n=1 Tax=Streptomyces sp. NPDC001941 TaxID=3154659 RepID=UPI003324BB22